MFPRFSSLTKYGIGLLCLFISLFGNELEATADTEKPPTLSLRDLLEAATRHSPVLTNAYFEAKSAAGLLTQSEAEENWQLGADITTVLSIARPASTTGMPATPQGTANARSSTALRTNLDLSKLLTTGGVFTFNLGTAQSGSPLPAESSSASAGIRLVQPLSRFRGQNPQQQRISQARISEQIAFYELSLAAQDEVLRIANSYRRLAVAEEVLVIREQSLALAERQLKIATAAIRSGVLPASEKSTVEQARFSREAAHVSAQLEILERSLQLRELVGMPIGPNQVLLKSEGLDTFGKRGGTLKESLNRAQQNNPSVKLTELRVRSRRESMRSAKLSSRPQLDLDLSLASIGRGGDTGQSLSNLSSGQGYEISAGLRGQWDIGGQRAKGAAQRARANRLASKIDLRAAKRNSSAATVRAWSRRKERRSQLRVAAKAVEFADKNITFSERRFRAGDITAFEVLLRHDEWARTKIAALEARLLLLNAGDQLSASTGDLLEHFDLVIDDEMGDL